MPYEKDMFDAIFRIENILIKTRCDIIKLRNEVQDLKEAIQEQKQYNPLLQPYPLENKCSVCGLELNKVMGYVCARSDCPTGLNGPTSSSSSS